MGPLDDEEESLNDAHPADFALDAGITDDFVDAEEEEEDLEMSGDKNGVLDDPNFGDDVDVGDPEENTKLYEPMHETEHDKGEQRAVVKCTTSAGPIVMNFHRAWSPNGYDRATSLFERGYYDQSHFFRVVPHFLVQFGISYTTDRELTHFADSHIPDDPKRKDLMPFKEGYMSFAGSGPNSRTSQLFIAYDKAGGLGNSPWETPFGEVVEGIENVRNLYSYGDMPPWGKGPEQGPIRNRGSKYIEENFPLLDKFQTCTVERMGDAPGEKAMKEVKHAKKPEAEVQQRMRGGGAKASDALKIKARQITRKMEDDKATDKSFPLYGKILIVLFVAALLGLILSRRKKSKQAGKAH